MSDAPRMTAEDRLPGDPDREETLARMIRVDQAGEYGAVRIYAGQRAFLPRGAAADAVDEMAAKEEEHLAAFDALVAERGIRPTALMPLWHVAGYALGAATALMGERAAMACTEAIEEVIDRHYAEQSAALGEDEAELRATIDEFRADEIEHRDLAVAHEAHGAPGYDLLTRAVKTGSRLAIWLSIRV
ncbi:MAG: demethoxyubiquinone hydroxylase family protein [Defluviicoccus sp.]|nr:demethoxyubiquinone hydroxylase family protein [Defluviicoccus sp.]